MRALVLVDLDNALADRPQGAALREFVTDAVAFLRNLGVSSDASVVVMACNTTTVREYGLSFESLRQAGKTVSAALGCSNLQFELALTLTMPQSADVVLERFVRDAPSSDGAGYFGCLAVFTQDEALRGSFQKHVETVCAGTWLTLGDDWRGMAWSAGPENRQLVRKPPKAGERPGPGEPPPGRDTYTFCVSGGRAVAAWAGNENVNVEPGVGLQKLSELVEADPWLLSQVGPTETSLRGVQRLEAFPTTERVKLGASTVKDGVELRGTGQRPSRVDTPSRASIGMGAARWAQGATIACRLPVQVLASVAGEFPVDAAGVGAARALQKVAVDSPLDGPTVCIGLEQRGSQVIASVARAFGKQPAAWWVWETRTSTELRFRAPHLVPRPVEGHGVLLRHAMLKGVSLGLCAPLARGASVRVDGPLAEGTLAQGWFAGDDGRPVPVAVLASSSGASGMVVVDPIHTVGRAGPLRSLPDEAFALPLVVTR